MRTTIKNFRKNLFERDKANNNIIVGNMAGFDSDDSMDFDVTEMYFDGIDEPVRRSYTLEEFDIDWNNMNDLEINFTY